MINAINLIDRKLYELEGGDVEKLLQGMITNNCSNLESGPIYSFLLSPQGKYLADLFIYKYRNKTFMEIPAEHSENIINKINLYKLRADFNITESNLSVFNSSQTTEGICFQDPRSKDLGYRIYSKKIDIELKDLECYIQKRIKLRIPEGENDFIYDKSYPFEYGDDILKAFDFKKGCYIGQEVVSRTYYRGNIRKKFVTITTDEDIENENKNIYLNGNEVGKAFSKSKNRALALIKSEYLENINNNVEHNLFCGKLLIAKIDY